jgi:hypothetical protein
VRVSRAVIGVQSFELRRGLQPPPTKILVLIMVLNPISHAVGLPDVDSGEVVFLITNQNVNTGSTEPERCRTSIDLERGTATSNPVYSWRSIRRTPSGSTWKEYVP